VHVVFTRVPSKGIRSKGSNKEVSVLDNHYFEVNSYCGYWIRRFERNRPELCSYCNKRVECLAKAEIYFAWCTVAWNRMVSIKGEHKTKA